MIFHKKLLVTTIATLTACHTTTATFVHPITGASKTCTITTIADLRGLIPWRNYTQCIETMSSQGFVNPDWTPWLSVDQHGKYFIDDGDDSS